MRSLVTEVALLLLVIDMVDLQAWKQFMRLIVIIQNLELGD